MTDNVMNRFTFNDKSLDEHVQAAMQAGAISAPVFFWVVNCLRDAEEARREAQEKEQDAIMARNRSAKQEQAENGRLRGLLGKCAVLLNDAKRWVVDGGPSNQELRAVSAECQVAASSSNWLVDEKALAASIPTVAAPPLDDRWMTVAHILCTDLGVTNSGRLDERLRLATANLDDLADTIRHAVEDSGIVGMGGYTLAGKVEALKAERDNCAHEVHQLRAQLVERGADAERYRYLVGKMIWRGPRCIQSLFEVPALSEGGPGDDALKLASVNACIDAKLTKQGEVAA